MPPSSFYYRGGEIGCFHNQTVREEAFVHGQRGCPQVQSLPALRVRLLVPPAPTAAMGSRLRAATAAEGADPDFGAVTGPPPRRKQRREPSPLTGLPSRLFRGWTQQAKEYGRPAPRLATPRAARRLPAAGRTRSGRLGWEATRRPPPAAFLTRVSQGCGRGRPRPPTCICRHSSTRCASPPTRASSRTLHSQRVHSRTHAPPCSGAGGG